MKKIYFTTKGYNEEIGDFSFYGIFAEVQKENAEKVFFERKQSGVWKKVECNKQIRYYEQCKKIDLVEFLKKQGKNSVKLFRRTAPRENGYVNGVAVSEYARQYGFSPERFQDKAFMDSNVCVVAQLTEGSLLALDNAALENCHSVSKGLPLRVVDKRYTQDKQYILRKTSVMIEAEEVVSALEKGLNDCIKRQNDSNLQLEKG